MFMVGSFIFTSVRSSLLSLSGDESNPQRISSSDQYVYQNGHYYQHYGQLDQYGQSISTVGQNKFYQDKEEHLDSSSTQGTDLISTLLTWVGLPSAFLLGSLAFPQYNLLNTITRSGFGYLDDKHYRSFQSDLDNINKIINKFDFNNQ